MSRSTVSIRSMSVALLCAGCSIWPAVTSVSPLGHVTRIEVKTGPGDNLVGVIDDPAKVGRIVEFVNDHRSGWGGESNGAGVPVPGVSASFYNGSEFLGNFGAGPGFFACFRGGDFTSKRSGAGQHRYFLVLMGLSAQECDW